MFAAGVAGGRLRPIGHYGGCDMENCSSLERAGKLTIAQALYCEWLLLFVRLKPEFSPPGERKTSIP
jgi:hypothetical protein